MLRNHTNKVKKVNSKVVTKRNNTLYRPQLQRKMTVKAPQSPHDQVTFQSPNQPDAINRLRAKTPLFKTTQLQYPTNEQSDVEFNQLRQGTLQQRKQMFPTQHSQMNQQQQQQQQLNQQQQQQQSSSNLTPQQSKMRKSLFGNLDIKKAIHDEQSFLRDPTQSDGKHLLNAPPSVSLNNNKQKPSKLKLRGQTIDKERIDLTSLEVQPYLENLKGAIVHHDLEQILASISGIIKFGDRKDIFDPLVDSEETILHKIASNNERHRKEYKVLLDNVKAITEVIMYDLETVSEMLNSGSNINKLHCTINTLQHLFSVYHIVPMPLNDPDLQLEHCSLDNIAAEIVKRSEDLDIATRGLDVYQERLERPAIRIISPLVGAIYMLILKRYGFTSGIVHTPMVGLVFATPPVSRQNIPDPDILSRSQQSSPYWYIKNLVTEHTQPYLKTNVKLTPVDCKQFCTPSIGAGRTMEQLATDFTCSCLTQNEIGYGGNFIYIDFLVNRVGQIPYTYKATNSIEALTTNKIELSSDTIHSEQDKFNWKLPYPIYSYKTMAMRLVYEPIFASNISNQLGVTLELAAGHLSSHIDNHPWRPKIVQVEYEGHEPTSDDLAYMAENDEDFDQFLSQHQNNTPF